ncbi:hypothetical protein OG373_34855 [Streptomyces avidinii]|uniref:hypothetical protein n=1 Tax=Streptomyces avidinii TaxID=1895 RepID=UPI0038638003|nr:hypothetical protein OG373_34855 [Streptomyces avidinii]
MVDVPRTGRQPGEQPVELPYEEITAPEYTALAAALFTLEEGGPDGTVLRGSCPRCGAVLVVRTAGESLRGLRLRSFPEAVRRMPAAPPAGERVEPMRCTCEDAHPGRPEGRVGCGASWTLLLTEEPG